jgi:hypothetical protein
MHRRSGPLPSDCIEARLERDMDAAQLTVVICTSVASVCGAVVAIYTVRMNIQNRRHEFDAAVELFKSAPAPESTAEVTAFVKAALRGRKADESSGGFRKLARLRSAS